MPNMCVSATGYKDAEKLRFDAISTASLYKQGVAIAQAALNAADAIDNFSKLNDITKRGVAIEEEQHAHLKDVFWPADDQILAEFTQPTPWETQSVLSTRYAGRLWAPLAAAFAKEIRKLECEKPRYCTNAHVKRMQELQVQRSAVRANVTLMADRLAFYEIQAVEETDFEKRKQAIGLYKGLVKQAQSLMEAAAGGYAGAGAQAMGAITNAITAFGAAWADRTRAQDGTSGADPYFHQQAARNVVQTPNPTYTFNEPAQYVGPTQEFATEGSNTFVGPVAPSYEVSFSGPTQDFATPGSDAFVGPMPE